MKESRARRGPASSRGGNTAGSTVAELNVVLARNAEATRDRVVANRVRRGGLIKVKRGIDATPDASLATISSRIEPKTYLSTGPVLAWTTIIGSASATVSLMQAVL